MNARNSGFTLAAIAAIAIGLLIPPVAASTRVGVMGPIKLRTTASAPDGTMQPAVPAQDVVVDEKIVTDTAGEADILLLDGSSMRIGPNTEMQIDQFSFAPQTGSGKLSFTADKGTLRFSGGDLSKHEDQVSIRTPTAILGVRGGMVLADIDANGATTATFLYGEELIITSKNGAVVRITTPGFFSIVPADGSAPSKPAVAGSKLLGAFVTKLQAGSSGNSITQFAGTQNTTQTPATPSTPTPVNQTLSTINSTTKITSTTLKTNAVKALTPPAPPPTPPPAPGGGPKIF